MWGTGPLSLLPSPMWVGGRLTSDPTVETEEEPPEMRGNMPLERLFFRGINLFYKDLMFLYDFHDNLLLFFKS